MANGFINNPWNPDLVEQLKRLVREGYSGGLIAARLGVSRNSVIGKVTRLGMKLGNSRNSQRNLAEQLRLKANYRKKRADRLRPPPPKVKFTVEPLPSAHTGDVARKSLLELGPHDCRYPVGDVRDAGFGFCAKERVPGSAYCQIHHARCSAGLPVKRRPEPNLARETAGVSG